MKIPYKFAFGISLKTIINCIKSISDSVGYLGVYDTVTGETGLPMLSLPALQTVRHSLHPYVLMASQGQVTDPAAEVLQVPEPVLGGGELGREDKLVTS